MKHAADDPVLDSETVCKILGISSSTLKRLRRQGAFPRPINISAKRIGWRRSTIETWVASRQVGLPSSVGAEHLTPEQIADNLKLGQIAKLLDNVGRGGEQLELIPSLERIGRPNELTKQIAERIAVDLVTRLGEKS